ncbi:chromate efflux transporter [Rhodoplanes sp. TEM]|uniref:Chromate efflux transporter n=1 Tax=Rhodoplanes tepidamans TaxID=200616 RepID=A0ABT5J8U5_RHOTP|nr:MULTISPECIES: chromate efflux transporter [Rhodoplanes]MDC7785996.1 chromate efflux transporter [Rhodoplanes tepidamans]MDC7984908.1 chromate efflux transporter [Rhodoplanes sp. TEM]MDQ0357037.1 chromate transporter [Rhodoplanes tepidamans]
MNADEPAAATGATRGTAAEVLVVFLCLGLTSFGGPVAHLGYFRDAFVTRLRWLDDRAYADLVALCQFLPGPASSQVGIAIGLSRAGLPGALAAWTGFTLPSAIALVLFAYGVKALGDVSGAGWLHGLKIVAVAVVAQAVLGMMRALAPDRRRATFAVIAAAIVLTMPSAWSQIGAILLGGLAGLVLLPRETDAPDHAALPLTVGRTAGIVSLVLFVMLLAGLPLVAAATGSHLAAMVEAFYRAGSLVFGGGHVVLPLLQAAVVPPGWVSNDAFLAGYGAAQAVPGPLFTFAAYLGAVAGPAPNGWLGATVALAAIFLPSFLLVIGALPFWEALRRRAAAQAMLKGVNAAVVGILLAALYDPVWTAAIHGGTDVALAGAAFLLLTAWAAPPWLVVLLGAGAGALLALV